MVSDQSPKGGPTPTEGKVVEMFAWRLERATAEVERIQQDRNATRDESETTMQEFVRASRVRKEAEVRAREARTQALADARRDGRDGQVRS